MSCVALQHQEESLGETDAESGAHLCFFEGGTVVVNPGARVFRLFFCLTVEASASSIIEWLYFIIVDACCLVMLMSLSAIVY